VAAVPGVDVQSEARGGVRVTRVVVRDQEGARALGKPPGRYTTIEAPGVRRRERDTLEQLARALATEIAAAHPLADDTQVLVVGLGNWNATPDALGPRVVANLTVTRHLRDHVPADLRGGLRSVAAVAPGVLGLTGIETSEIVGGIVDRVRPDLVLVVDALASQSVNRLLTTVQLADTGIQPGSGVHNDRAGISRESLGVPVLAIGVPTVVQASTIAVEAMDLLTGRLQRGTADPFWRLPSRERAAVVRDTLYPFVGDLMVTPKEIDVLVDDLASAVAAGINAALHPRVAQAPTLL
ncbi:MAG: GPR endopeptidase, partial [Clostridia bacterium]|nr:GPR endopeptidase [Clostridia bacterium]